MYSIALAVFHLFFWKIFHWKSDLINLNFANSAIIQILNIQVIYYFLFTAVICFLFPLELASTNLGAFFLAGSSGFWMIRTVQQFIFYV